MSLPLYVCTGNNRNVIDTAVTGEMKKVINSAQG